ncbi:bifunctional DNA-formamidopyrimidine glycosylase/DNA-(apurinic or apyrimidinic site) lyase [Chungangia koreensis]|uniref:Formamidopyrimidine-DNA glycosylase n=1 Tax=Chungangia koreensis TaxID=752657 RepID=A0ABV8X300_9LACT
MPELPEVEGVVRSLRPVAIGRTLNKVRVSETIYRSKSEGKEAILKGIDPDEFIKRMEGMKILDITRRSKYIYFRLKKGNTEYLFVNHLGMTGAWFTVNRIDEITEEKFRKHIHVIFEAEEGFLIFSDIRRFGEMRLLRSEEDYPPLLLMAPEPFDEMALSHFLSMCELPKYKEKPIKEVIMDGHVISGCGNIYATEALFRMGIRPSRKVKMISKARKEELFITIVSILNESIEAGGSTISDYRNINGEAGGMQHRLKMYGRKVCLTCGTPTKSLQIGGRTSVYCPACQK